MKTTMKQQFDAIKNEYNDVLLLFRVGGVYEAYYDDAKDVAMILGITLTTSSRRVDESGTEVSLAYFPFNYLDDFLPRIVRAGRRVAICDSIL